MPEKRDLAAVAEHIFRETLNDCAVQRAFDGHQIDVDLSAMQRVVVIAAGKAGATLLQGLLRSVSLPPDSELTGVLISPQRPEWLPSGIKFYAGGHPLPNADSMAGARAALSAIPAANDMQRFARTFCFFLFSGGASSMLELPLDASITLPDLVALYQALVHSGAPIAEINWRCIDTRHTSSLKSGREIADRPSAGSQIFVAPLRFVDSAL